jgi:hypothetical protein
MTDLDALLRAADPAARLTPPEPGRPPVHRPPVHRPPVDRPVPADRRGTRWLPATAAAAAVVAVVAVVGLGVRDDVPGPAAAPAPATTTPTPPPTGRPTTPATRPTPTPETPTATPTGAEVAGPGADQDRALRLLSALRAVVPAGYATPDGMVPAGLDGAPIDATYARAARVPGKPVTGLIYDVNQFVTAGRGLGSVGVTVFDGVPAADDPCVVFDRLEWLVGDCTPVRTPAGDRVGLVTWKVGGDVRGSRYALFRHPDGTAVLVAETNGTNNDKGTPLPAMPFSDARLALLATDPAFAR